MFMSELGAGVALNQHWDFDVDESGDIATAVGLEELQKDVAFNISRSLETMLGRRIDTSTSRRIAIAVEDEFAADPRISTINDVSVNRIDMTDRFEVVANVDSGDGPFDLVFEVNP